jgi:DNA-directed RNA polymerase specialized sigma24 family protein
MNWRALIGDDREYGNLKYALKLAKVFGQRYPILDHWELESRAVEQWNIGRGDDLALVSCRVFRELNRYRRWELAQKRNPNRVIDDFDLEIVEARRAGDFEELIQGVHPVEKEVLRLTFLHRCTNYEIAEITRVSHTTVSKRLKSALMKIKELG